MEEVTALIDEATKAFRVADHLTYVTYPVVTDPKLVISIAEKLHEALTKCMDALIWHEYLYKRIDAVPETFREKFTLFKQSLTKRYAISQDVITALADLAALMENRKHASVEFTRRDKYVIAQRDFQLRTITMHTLKRYFPAAQSFLTQVSILVNHGNPRRTR